MAIDPVTYALISQALIAIGREAAAVAADVGQGYVAAATAAAAYGGASAAAGSPATSASSGRNP